jgi:stage III sporulation protein AH
MNTRRQTIWLVSMLSLMVVLSAYYLFTEDLDTGPKGTEHAAADDHGIAVHEAEPGSEWAADGSDLSAEEAEVLRQLEAQGIGTSGGDYIAKLQYARAEEFAEEAERLYGIIADTSLDPGESSAAMEQLSRLEEKEEKITGIEEQLQARFPNVVVTEENNRYKVVVQSEKLGAADAVEIVDLVMKTMDVSADRVSVQYVP